MTTQTASRSTRSPRDAVTLDHTLAAVRREAARWALAAGVAYDNGAGLKLSSRNEWRRQQGGSNLDQFVSVADITAGLGGPEDPLAAEAKREAQFLGTQKVAARPDYTLSGKIIENRTRQGNRNESTYVFQMALATRDGLAVWEEEKTITKQSKRSAVGW